MQLVKEVAEYYDSLAKGYHRRFGYDKVNDTQEFNEIRDLISGIFTGRDVLEIACGTGYWTSIVARVAKSVMATDLNRSMISEAEQLLSGYKNISFDEADAFSLKNITGLFSGAISVLWWCHVPRKKIPVFLNALHSKLKPGSKVLHICQLEDLDSRNHTIEPNGDTIAQRKSEERIFKIIKNIPSEPYLREILGNVARDIKYSRYPDSGLWNVVYTI
jgi:SAM-dependent methyltransferase